MLRALIDRPVSVVIATLALVVIGLFSLLRLPVSLLPTLERPRLLVVAQDDERSREDFLHAVVEPLERRFLSLKGVLEVASTVEDGRCRLTLSTEWQTDVDRLRIDAERRLADVASLDLELEITVEAGDRRPILEIAVLGGRSAHARTVFADEVLIPELGRLAGAGRIRRFGGALLRPVVRPNAAALAARGLTAAEVVERLLSAGASRPAGRLRDGARVRPMIFAEPVNSIDELRGLRLGEGSTTLADVADVALEEVPDTSQFRSNGEEAVVVELHRAPGANAVLLARVARQAVAELQERRDVALQAAQGNDKVLRIAVVRDASLEVVEALLQLGLAGFIGLALGTLVMRFMLGSWRPTLALAVVVPASLVAAFGGFYLWDVSLDIVSLAGLALAAGMLVDNSIVVLEAIAGARGRREDDAVVAGTHQIALALVASFLTTAVVFVPLVYLKGLARAFFGVQAFAIVTALVVSLALSLTLTPVLSRWLSGRGAKQEPTERAQRGRSPGRGLYLAVLDRALAHPWLVIVATIVFLAAGAALVPGMTRELVPRGPSRVVVVEYRLPSALSPEETRSRLAEIDQRLLAAATTAGGASPETVVSLYRGRDSENRVLAEEADRGEMELVYADFSQTDAARGRLVKALSQLPGVEGEVRLRRSAVAAALERSRARIEVEASATTATRAEALAHRVASWLATSLNAEARPLHAGHTGSVRPRPAFVLDWKPLRFAQLHGDTDAVAWQVRAALGGFEAGRVGIEGVEAEILVETTRPGDPRLLPVRLPRPANGDASDNAGPDVVPLSAVATVERRFEEPALERRNGRPAVVMAVDVPGRVKPPDVTAAIAGMGLAVDEKVRLVGQAHELERSFRQLRWALGLALVLVFLTVAALYESLAMPLVVMTTVPVAVVGALGVLKLAGQSLNVMSFMGLILLAGIVVNNAIVLVHRIEQRLDAGQDAVVAIREAASERYRPILMTTMTTLLGMIPLAALGGEGVELRRALALAVTGGLVTSLFAALVVVPVLHRALVRRGA
jgi:HAE1 family hydrophobic/amphiphilic exporter-1